MEIYRCENCGETIEVNIDDKKYIKSREKLDNRDVYFVDIEVICENCGNVMTVSSYDN